MLGGEAILYWLTLWLSLQFSLEDLGAGPGNAAATSQRYNRIPEKDVQYWTQHMSEVMFQFNDEEVCFFLPQLVKVILRRDMQSREQRVTSQVARNLAMFMQARCRANCDLGMQVIRQFRASAADLHTDDAPDMMARQRSQAWLGDFEMATMHGNTLPLQLRHRRVRYYHDSMRFIDRLVMLSFRMQAIPQRYRASEMQLELADLSKCLLRRMNTRGKAFELPGGYHGGVEWLDDQHVAQTCPEAAKFALHLPLRTLMPYKIDSRYALRVLRIAKDLCTVLPSREKAPFLVVAEVLQSSIPYDSDRIFTQGGDIGVTCEDIVARRITPKKLLEELERTRQPEDEWIEHSGGGGGGARPMMGRERETRDIDMGDLDDFEEELQQEQAAGPYPSQQQHGHGRGGWRRREVESRDEDAAEDGDRAYFDKTYYQLLQKRENHLSPRIQRMRLILSQVFENVSSLRNQVYREASPFGHLKGWKLASFIVKAGDDIRQEALAMQVISLVDRIFRKERLRLWLRPYNILCSGENAGLVECIVDAKSVHQIKKTTPNYVNMEDFFDRLFLGRDSELYARAQNNFVRSLAAYSIITYLLQVKDRHNGNIMLDVRGHIIHIDFGFILGAAPGMWKHETAPFKLTQDYLDMMGGVTSPAYWHFRELFLAGFKAIQKHVDALVATIMAEVSPTDKRAMLQVELLRKRLEDPRTDGDILSLIDRSLNSWTTNQYDYFQLVQNGIQP